MASISLSGWFKCIKYSMFVFCLIAWVIGLITFIIGIVARVTGSFGLLDSHIPAVHSGANLLIAVGLFITIMGFLGCCGTIRESQLLLFLFFLFVFFCFSLLMAAGLWAVAWSYKFSCCGVQSAADYGTKGVPRSCGIHTSQNSGCHKVLVDTCKSNLSLICGIGITFALIMIVGMVCSMMLCCALREIS
ncbi:CD9 antigen [Paragonimus westermani]|uniref:Tetraspanin n=1 Tax=Paragonimus westermani TaxID=34504 RepID=A0A5J4NKW0_9TREM|nr:CD9 antigen [Paragonimus westermani]